MKTISKVVAIVSILIVITTLILILSKPEVEFNTQYCTEDNQCVRQSSCCDCGLGIYVNEKYYEHKECEQECNCESEYSRGLCINNTCTAVTLDEFCGKRKPSEQWEQNGEVCMCLAGQVVCGTKEQRAIRNQAKESLNKYYENIDTSCTIDDDCTVKDVHGCCGYLPQCVSQTFNPLPEDVKEWCTISQTPAICGFATINGCKCVEGTCKSII